MGGGTMVEPPVARARGSCVSAVEPGVAQGAWEPRSSLLMARTRCVRAVEPGVAHGAAELASALACTVVEPPVARCAGHRSEHGPAQQTARLGGAGTPAVCIKTSFVSAEQALVWGMRCLHHVGLVS